MLRIARMLPVVLSSTCSKLAGGCLRHAGGATLALGALLLIAPTVRAADLELPAGTVRAISVVRGVSTSAGYVAPNVFGPVSYSITTTRDYTPTDRLVFRASGTIELCPDCPNGRGFSSNPAGIVVGPDPTNTGARPGATSSGLGIPHFGALLIGNSALGYFEVFPVSPATGLGDPTPPLTLSSCRELRDVFAVPSFTGLPEGTTLELRVADSDFANNVRSFEIQATGVPAIANHPQSTAVCPAGDGQLTAVFAGSGTPSYSWQVDDPATPGTWLNLANGPLTINGITWGTISDATTATLRAQPDPLTYSVASTLRFRCIVTNACGSVTSDAATLTVLQPCSIADVCPIGGPAPGSCPDGLLTGDDFNAFISAFAAGEPLADVVSIGGLPPGDGLITGDDFNAFIGAFAGGCP